MATKTEIYVSSGVSWGAIFAGSAIAAGISIVMMQFGSAIGLSAESPLRGEANLAAWSIIATAIWLIWVQLIASLAGGYTAGYMRAPTPSYKPHENEMLDGIHGFAAWAVSTVAVFIAVSIMAFGASYLTIAAGEYEAPDALTDTEQNTAIIFAFGAGATSLVSAVAAWWAATMGGDHRATGIDFSKELSFKNK